MPSAMLNVVVATAIPHAHTRHGHHGDQRAAAEAARRVADVREQKGHARPDEIARPMFSVRLWDGPIHR